MGEDQPVAEFIILHVVKCVRTIVPGGRRCPLIDRRQGGVIGAQGERVVADQTREDSRIGATLAINVIVERDGDDVVASPAEDIGVSGCCLSGGFGDRHIVRVGDPLRRGGRYRKSRIREVQGEDVKVGGRGRRCGRVAARSLAGSAIAVVPVAIVWETVTISAPGDFRSTTVLPSPVTE